jgi:hypothetical protein
MELEILKTISYEKLISTSIYDFIKFYLLDFRNNNKYKIIEKNYEEHLNNFENIVIYFAKLSYHYEDFFKYSMSVKAISCFTAGFELYKIYEHLGQNENKEKFLKYFKKWIEFTIERSGHPGNIIKDAHHNLILCHSNTIDIPEESFRLNKFHKII